MLVKRRFIQDVTQTCLVPQGVFGVMIENLCHIPLNLAAVLDNIGQVGKFFNCSPYLLTYLSIPLNSIEPKFNSLVLTLQLFLI